MRPDVYNEIFFIGSEALRNAFHHASAQRIQLQVHYDSDAFRLVVTDNGKGVDPAVLATGSRDGHFGLAGMRERAALIGGTLTLQSAVGIGTILELRVPATRAY